MYRQRLSQVPDRKLLIHVNRYVLFFPSGRHSIHLVCASSGIGLETSLLFAQEGADVLLVDINLDAAERTLKLVKERSPNVQAAAVRADVGKEADVKAAVDKAVELFGRLDVMVRRSYPPCQAHAQIPPSKLAHDLDKKTN